MAGGTTISGEAVNSSSVDRPALTGMALVIYAASIGLHEAAHAAAALVAGGIPTLISSTDMRADLTHVSTGGYTLIGVSGSAMNAVLAACGIALARWGKTSPARLFGWIVAAVNGFLAATYMAFSPVAGFGDWMTILRRGPYPLAGRAAVAVVGLGLVFWWVSVTARSLARMLPVARADRTARATEIARTAWVAGGTLAVLAALLSPLGLLWAVPVAIGSTFGTTWPMLLAADRAATLSGDGLAPVTLPRRIPWIAAGLAAAALFVLCLGPGLRL